jgi:hypothetical protein
VKRVLKVIGKNEGKKKFGLFCIFKDFGEYYVIANLASNIPFFTGRFCILMVNLPSLRPAVTGIRIIDAHKEMVIVYNLPKEADKFMTIGQ